MEFVFDVIIENIASQIHSRYEEMRDICATFKAIFRISTNLDDNDAIMKLISTYSDLSEKLKCII